MSVIAIGFQAHLELEVPNYYPPNDPLLTYATPLHENEQHTSTREELIGKTKTNDNSDNEESETKSKSWQHDHAYLKEKSGSGSGVAETPPNGSTRKGRLVKGKQVDYKHTRWPRDALYICYKDARFEYVTDMEANGDEPYYCDCCDPSRNQTRKRRHSSSSSSSEEEGEENGENGNNSSDNESDQAEDDQDEEDKVSTTSSSVENGTANGTNGTNGNGDNDSNTDSPTASRLSGPAPPGWFGKGRRKRSRN